MAPKEKRVTIVRLEEVLRRTKDFGKRPNDGVVIREREKTDPYSVAAVSRKGGRE